MSFSNAIAYFFAGYAALTVFFYALSMVIPKAGFVARLLAFYISMLLSAAFGIVASIILTLSGHQQIAQWLTGRSFKYISRFTTGVEFVVNDPKNILGTTRPAVFIGNHQTEMDVLMLGTMFPKYCSVTAKASLKRTPFLGWFMSLSGSIFIDRKNTKDAREAMKGAALEIQNKRQSVYMFPEGTRSYSKDPVLLPFKKGAFHLAIQAGVPIVPVVVANYSHILHFKSLVWNAGKIPIEVLDPIPTKNLTADDVNELASTTRELMLEKLVKLTSKTQNRPIAMPAAETTKSTGKSSGIDTKTNSH